MYNDELTEKALTLSGLPKEWMSRFCKLLPSVLIEEPVEYTNQQLVKDGKQITNASELRYMIALFWVRTRCV